MDGEMETQYEYAGIQLSMYSSDQARRVARVEITASQIMSKNQSLNTGPNSLFLGSTKPGSLCLTCFEPAGKCDGHLGCISLGVPIFNSDTVDKVLKVMQCVCFWCGRFLALSLIVQPLPLPSTLSELSHEDFEALRGLLNSRVVTERELFERLEARNAGALPVVEHEEVEGLDPSLSSAEELSESDEPHSEGDMDHAEMEAEGMGEGEGEGEVEVEVEGEDVAEIETDEEDAREARDGGEEREEAQSPSGKNEEEGEQDMHGEEHRQEVRTDAGNETEAQSGMKRTVRGDQSCRPVKRQRTFNSVPSKVLFAAKTHAAADLLTFINILKAHKGKQRLAAVANECKKVKVCGGQFGDGCRLAQPVFYREGHFVAARVADVNLPARARKNQSKRRFMRRQDHVPVSGDELRSYALHVLVSLRTYRLLEQMPDATAVLLGFNHKITPPAAWMFSTLVVGAPRTRPGVDIKDKESLKGHNDLTCELQKIVRHNSALKKHLSTFLQHYRAQEEASPDDEHFKSLRPWLDPIAACGLQLDAYFLERYGCHFWEQPKLASSEKLASEHSGSDSDSPVLKGRTMRKFKSPTKTAKPAPILAQVVRERCARVKSEVPKPPRATVSVGEEMFVDAADGVLDPQAVILEPGQPSTRLELILLALRSMSFAFDMLQEEVGTMINNTERASVKLSMQPNGRATKSIHERLNGKDGLARGHGIGKRRDYSARTPLMPDPTLPIGWFGCPRLFAQKLTIPERVNPFNVHRLTAAVRNGPARYPGANFILVRALGCAEPDRYDLRFVDCDSIVLANGMVVERHAVNGDQFVLNRQPSLHRVSMMVHRADVREHDLAMSLNVEVMAPYGADADGDELNILGLRSEGARVAGLMLTPDKHIFSAKHGDTLIRFQLDSVIGPYYLTLPSTVIDRCAASMLLCQVNEKLLPKPLNLPPSDKLLPDAKGDLTVPGWSGRSLFSVLLPPDLSLDTKGAPDGVLLAPSNVVVRNGQLTKGTLNGGALGRLLSSIEKGYGSAQAAAFVHSVVQMCTHFLRSHGLSVGFSDCENPNKEFTNTMRERAVSWALAQPGPAAHGSEAEAKLVQVFDSARTRAGNVVLHAMKARHSLSERADGRSKGNSVYRNGILELITSGTKSSMVILTQLSVFLGLQLRNGKRMLENVPLRTEAQAAWASNVNGFIQKSFQEGVGPEEFVYQGMVGREGIVGTAVKTALVGYLQRKLVNGMNGMMVSGDGAVRLADGSIMAVSYGRDNFNGMRVEWTTLPSLMLSKEGVRARETSFLPNDPWAEELQLVAEAVVAEITRHREYFLTLKATDSVLASQIDTQRAGQVLALGGVKEIYAACCSEGLEFSELSPKELLDAIEGFIVTEILPFHHGYAPAAFVATVREVFSPAQLLKARVTRQNLLRVLAQLKTLHTRSLVGVHEQVGVIAAQSFGEPITQMTLKSPHTSGHHSGMVMGVPRTNEIINATKTASMHTPIMTFTLLKDPSSEHAARVFAAQMTHTLLSAVALAGQVLESGTPWLSDDEKLRVQHTRTLAGKGSAATLRGMRVVLKRCELLKRGLAPATVAAACVHSALARCTGLVVVCSPLHAPDFFEADPPWLRFEFDADDAFMLGVVDRFLKNSKASLVNEEGEGGEDPAEVDALPPTLATAWDFALQALLSRLLHSTGISGWEKVSSADVRVAKTLDHRTVCDLGARASSCTRVEVVTAGCDFERLLLHPEVEWHTAVTNSIREVAESLGIAAARRWIVMQIEDVLAHSGSFVHSRHIELIAAVMTRTGRVQSFSRFEVIRSIESPFARSSFEVCARTLSEAAAFGELDKLQGVAENIMLGNTAPLGTAKVRVGDPPASLYNDWKFCEISLKNRAALRARRVRLREPLLASALKNPGQLPWSQQGDTNVQMAQWVTLLNRVKKSNLVDAGQHATSLERTAQTKFVFRPPNFEPLTFELVQHLASEEDLARALEGTFVCRPRTFAPKKPKVRRFQEKEKVKRHVLPVENKLESCGFAARKEQETQAKNTVILQWD